MKIVVGRIVDHLCRLMMVHAQRCEKIPNLFVFSLVFVKKENKVYCALLFVSCRVASIRQHHQTYCMQDSQQNVNEMFDDLMHCLLIVQASPSNHVDQELTHLVSQWFDVTDTTLTDEFQRLYVVLLCFVFPAI